MVRLASEAESAVRARDPRALALLHRLSNTNTFFERTGRVRDTLSRILGFRGPVDPLVLAHARYLRAGLYEEEGQWGDATRLRSEIGLVTQGMVLGPFDNSAGRGHDEIYAPEIRIDLDEPTQGKESAITWRDTFHLAAHGVFELSHLVEPERDGTAYVLVAVDAKRDTDAALRTGSVDQLKAFLDGREVFSIDSRRTLALDQDAIAIRIPAGQSTLLLKSSWNGPLGRVLFRLTAPDGAPLRDVSVRGDTAAIRDAIHATQQRASRTERTKGTRATTRVAVAGVSDGIDRALKHARGKARAEALSLRADLYAVLSLFDRRKLPTPPETDLEEAIRLDPKSPLLRFFFAHRVHPRDPALAHEQLEAALAADPGYVPALLELAEMARGAGLQVAAQGMLREATRRDPRFVAAQIARALLRSDLETERPSALSDLLKADGARESPSILAEAARIEHAMGDRIGAKRDAEAALAIDATQAEARNLVIQIALDAGDRETARTRIDEQIRAGPWKVWSYLKKARFLSGQDLGEALAVVAEAGRLFPGAPEVPRLDAELLLSSNRKDEALLRLERSLELDPHQPEVRRHRDALAGLSRELEDEYTVDARSFLDAPVSEDEKTWGAIYLADRSATRLYENGKSTRFRQTIIRLSNPRLKDSLRTDRIFYAPSREVVEILSAERIRPSGEVFKATQTTDGGSPGKVGGMYLDRRFKTIVFDDLAEGDLVHVRYRVDSVGENIFGGFFGDVAALQSSLPKRNVFYTAITPKDRPLYVGLIRAHAPTTKSDGKVNLLSWTYDRLDALDFEPMAPPYPNVGSMVSLSTYRTWDDLGKWYAKLFKDQLELDEPARTEARRAIRGARSDEERIRLLYDYVVKNTRYVGIELGIHGWKPFKASEVHRRRYGDCKDKATLLAALLRDNGIEATIALVRTADRGDLPADHATMWAFNHAVTYVPSQHLFLDGTAEFSGSRELPYLDQGGLSLVVYPDGRTEFLRLPVSAADDNLNTSSYVATLGRDGALSIEGSEQFYGARAASLRHEFEEVEQRKTQLEKTLNQVFAGVRVTEVGFSELHDLEAPVEYRYAATIERYGVVENHRVIIPMSLFQHKVASAYGSLAERKLDLYVDHPWSTRNVVRYRLPSGASLEVLPEGVSVDTPHIALRQIVSRVEGGFQTDDTVSLKSRRIPAADYAEFRKACLAIDRALARNVVIAP